MSNGEESQRKLRQHQQEESQLEKEDGGGQPIPQQQGPRRLSPNFHIERSVVSQQGTVTSSSGTAVASNAPRRTPAASASVSSYSSPASTSIVAHAAGAEVDGLISRGRRRARSGSASSSTSASSSDGPGGRDDTNRLRVPAYSSSSSSSPSQGTISDFLHTPRVQAQHAVISTISSLESFASRQLSPSQRRPKVGEVIRRINSPRPVPPSLSQQQQQVDSTRTRAKQSSGTDAAECRAVSSVDQTPEHDRINGAQDVCSSTNRPKKAAGDGSANDTPGAASPSPQPALSPQLSAPLHNVVPPGVAVPGEAAQWSPVPWANLERPRGGTWNFSYPLLTSVAPDPEQCPCRMRGSSVSGASSPPSQSPTSKTRARAGCERVVVYDWHRDCQDTPIRVAGKAVSRSALPTRPGSPSPQKIRGMYKNGDSPHSSIGSPFQLNRSGDNFEDLDLLAVASSDLFSGDADVPTAKLSGESDDNHSGDDSDGDGDGVESLSDSPVKLIDVKEEEEEEEEEEGKIPGLPAGIFKAAENGNRELENAEQQEGSERRRRRERLKSLSFDSHFESGNLLRATKVGPFEYDLYIRPDINTTGFQQWWYFSMCNTHPPGWERQLEQAQLARKKAAEKPPKQDASLEAAAELGMPTSALDIEYPPEDEASRDLRVLGKGPGGTGLDWTGAMTYRFNIVNLCKPDSMYNRGMQPVMYSCRDAEERGIGWRRTGCDISYFGNDLIRGGDNPNGHHHYTLTFKVSFSRPENVYLLAHSVPYTWTDNLRHVDALLTLRPDCVRRSILCHTLAGRECDLLTITDFDTGELGHGGSGPGGAKEASKEHYLESGLASDHISNGGVRGGGCGGGRGRSGDDFSSSSGGRGGWLNTNGGSGSGTHSSGGGPCGGSGSSSSGNHVAVGDVEDADGLGNTHLRRVIVMTARVHPGETPASWIAKGFIDFISSKAPAARLLRRMFVFKIVPMINPDGVFYGNNRCSLAGVDLNRQWQKPTPHMHPTILNSKAMIRHLHGTRECALYVDMHAHSRKGNVFMYGVEEKNRMKPTVRLFPAVLDKCPFADALFSFKDCTFNVGRGRESTARVVVARELFVKHSYTVESSYCGPDEGPLARTQFNTRHLEMVGVGMADTLLQVYHPNTSMRRYAQQELGEISLRIRGDKRAKRLLARAQERRRMAAAERYATWAQRNKREQRKVRLGKVPASVLGNTFHGASSSSSSSSSSSLRSSSGGDMSKTGSWSDDWGKTVVEGYSAVVQDGVCLKMPTGLITPEWYRQLGMGVGLFWNHKKKLGRRRKAAIARAKARAEAESKASKSSDAADIDHGYPESGAAVDEHGGMVAGGQSHSAGSASNVVPPAAPSTNPSSPFTSVGVGGAQTSRSMRKLNHMMFGGERGGGGKHNGLVNGGGRRLSNAARGHLKMRASAASAVAAAALNASTESGYVPYSHYGFLSKQISMARRAHAEAEESEAAAAETAASKASNTATVADVDAASTKIAKNSPALFGGASATESTTMTSPFPRAGRLSRSGKGAPTLPERKEGSPQKRIIRTAGARTRRTESKHEQQRSTDTDSVTTLTSSNSAHSSRRTPIPHRPVEANRGVQNSVFEFVDDPKSSQIFHTPIIRTRPFVAGGSPNGRGVDTGSGFGGDSSPAVTGDGPSNRNRSADVATDDDELFYVGEPVQRRHHRGGNQRRSSRDVNTAHAKAKANLEKAAAAATIAARRSEKRGSVADNLNPKLLYASMPPRARRAIERRLNSMLSSNAVTASVGANVYVDVNDSNTATDKAKGLRRNSNPDAVQKTNRGRVTGTVLAKSSATKSSHMASIVGNAGDAATMVVAATSGRTPTNVRKKRSRRMRVKHRRGSVRKSKKKSKRGHDKEARSSHIVSTVNKSKIHTREVRSGGAVVQTERGQGQANGSASRSSILSANVDASDSTTTSRSTFQGSYAAAYLRQASSAETTKSLTATLVKSLAQAQSSVVPRPGASKNVSNFLSANMSPGHPHPPKHQTSVGSDVVWIAHNNGASKSGIPGRPLAMNSYSSGGTVHHRPVHSPHLRQYRTSNIRTGTALSPHDQQLATGIDASIPSALASTDQRDAGQQRPYSSSWAREGVGESGNGGGEGNRTPAGSTGGGRRKFGHSSAVGSAAAAAAARRGDPNRKSMKRFLPNLDGGGGGALERERWGLAFSPIAKPADTSN